MKQKIYLVRYYGGSYEDSYDAVIFATTSESKAKKYSQRFNRILKKWKEYYSQFEEVKYGSILCIKDEYIDKFDRWNKLCRVSRCYYQEIELR